MSAPLRHLCTYFDARYLSRGLALYDSLCAHAGAFHLFVLSLDDEVHGALSALPHVTAWRLADLEGARPALAAAKSTRSWLEYYYTCTPAWIEFVLERDETVDRLTYLDADLHFFSSPEPLYAEIGDASIAIVEHRFPEALQRLEEYGRFNVGWVSFRRGAEARACLERWREQCLEWCYDQVEPTRFGDQKYLDEWPSRYAGLRVLRHAGANLAPWNVARYDVGESAGRVRVDGAPLVFYHFHGLSYVRPGPFRSGLAPYAAAMTPVLRRHVYRPYIGALLRHDRQAGVGFRRNRKP